MTFKTFKQRPGVETAYQSAVVVAKSPGELFWLALVGDNGNGKTHLAVSIIHEWLKAGIPAKYVLVSLLLDELRVGFRHEKDGDYENSYTQRFAYYCNVQLLLLDDYGMESSTPWVQEKLDTIVDYRLMHNLSLLVTSNRTLDQMPARIRSRIMRHPKGKIVCITAGDYALRGKP
jgi:DNA replication protein DnaC